MKLKYAIKYAFEDKYLAQASESDKKFAPNRIYAFHTCSAVYEIALFNSKVEAIEAYENSNSNPLNEVGMIVEIIVQK